MKPRWWMVVVCAAFALGCGDEKPKTSDSVGDNPKSTTHDSPIDLAGEERGHHTTKEDPRTPTARPDSMPSDVPMYPYVEIKLTPGEAKAKMMMMETDDAFDDVRSHYLNELRQSGWTILHNAPQAIVAEKGERKTSVSISEVASRTRIIMNFIGQ